VSRPEVSVVMPFAGGPTAARAAAAALRSLRTRPGDELILVDNSGTVETADDLVVVQATAERSPAHARNTGAARASAGWILFLDADCRPVPDLLDAYFLDPVPEDVGALVGEVVAGAEAQTLAGRYGAARGFLSQRTHLEHPFRPRAAAANLMVRRSAFRQVGGFFEGLRAAEDTDLSWRLIQAGWRLEHRPQAWAEHRYRTSLRELRRQWRGYAAGRAWLARRYEGFRPQPALVRAVRRGRARVSGGSATPRAAPSVSARRERASYLALDGLLAAEELVGFVLSNRPTSERGTGRSGSAASVETVLVADRFPRAGDPLAELAGSLDRARVEAVARPDAPDAEARCGLEVSYLEDDGVAARWAAVTRLLVRHPLRCWRDRRGAGQTDLPLRVLAPAVLRLERDGEARLQALGPEPARTIAGRLTALSGRALER
jgi:GT2 family glycosyltransferase